MTALPTDKPILFSAPMVRALLAGHKTCTRRVITSARTLATIERRPFTLKGAALERAMLEAREFKSHGDNIWSWTAKAYDYQNQDRTNWHARIGHTVGDRLWVRETWANVPPVVSKAPHACNRADYFPPLSDFPAGNALEGGDKRWRPSIFMPRWASRISLKVTAVKIERLQDISEADARAEGVERLKSGRGFYHPLYDHGHVHIGYCDTAKLAFEIIWESINGEGSWDANPYVVACSFERVQ